MTWQDLIISGATIIFIFSLIEQIYEIIKKKHCDLSIITCSLYSIGLFAMAYAMFTLSLTFSSIVTGINAILWAILLFLTIKYKQN